LALAFGIARSRSRPRSGGGGGGAEAQNGGDDPEGEEGDTFCDEETTIGWADASKAGWRVLVV